MVDGGRYEMVCWIIQRQPVMVLRREKTRKPDGDDEREEVRSLMTMLTFRRAKALSGGRQSRTTGRHQDALVLTARRIGEREQEGVST